MYKNLKKQAVRDFIEGFEKDHFRTVHDTGANYHTMFVWNMVRSRAGMSRLEITDLRAFCQKCKEYHVSPCSWKPSQYDEKWVIEAFERAGFKE